MNKNLVFIGCYTRWLPWMEGGPQDMVHCKGIYTGELNPATGKITPLTSNNEVENPSYIAISHNKRYLYAVSEVNDYTGEKSGAIAAFKINSQTGELQFLNQQATQGADPCHISVVQKDNYLIVSNYSGGSIIIFNLNEDGSIGKQTQFIEYQGSSINQQRQTSSHPHSATLSPDEKYLFVQDLGADSIYQYHFDPNTGTIKKNDPFIFKSHPGAGPRHFIFHPLKPYCYGVNELSNTVSCYEYITGQLLEKQIIATLPNEFQNENTAADIQITSDGRFLYVSNRGHNSLAIFAIHEYTGALAFIEHQTTLGKTPRNFCITANNKFLLCTNQNSNDVITFIIDANTGKLTPTGGVLNIGMPACIKT